jgi:hypothetical protein
MVVQSLSVGHPADPTLQLFSATNGLYAKVAFDDGSDCAEAVLTIPAVKSAKTAAVVLIAVIF